MKNWNTTSRTLMVAGFLFALGVNQNILQAAVFDGGEYAQSKVSSHTDLGAEGPEPQPSNFAFEQDRFSSAPVGKPLYVLGDDHKCYWGNFAYNKFEKALIVYYKTPLSSDRCIYQKQLDSKPSGYSISTKMGGVCVPTLGVGDSTANNSWKLEEVGNPVAFSLCVEQTASYGDYFKKSVPERQVAETSVEQKTTAAVTPDTKVAANDDAKVETLTLGPSVQETNAPWKSGVIYREGFPSLNHETKNWHEPDTTTATPRDTAAVGAVSQAPVATAPTTTPAFTLPGASAVIPDGIITKSNEGGFTVQISSHTSKDEAMKVADKLKARGVDDTWIMQADVRGVTYFRVCTGHYATAKAARLAQPKVAVKSGVKEAFIQKVVDDRAPASVPSHD